MRIAILTTHGANNFGAVLQAFSLLRACKELGADVRVVDWRCPAFESLYHKWGRLPRHPFHLVKEIYRRCFQEGLLRRKFTHFRKLLSLTEPVEQISEIQSIEMEFDAFIVGSDQIWNPPITAVDWKPELFDRAYLLKFASKCRRYAYAASIGKSAIRPESMVPEFVDAFKKFDLITMREQDGADYVSSLCGRKVACVLDPVLLHDASFWHDVAQTESIHPEGKYIIAYNLNGSRWLYEQAEKYASEHGMCAFNVAVPAIPDTWYHLSPVGAGPAGFVNLIEHAHCIFSSSFHACAFSALFGRPFYLFTRSNKNDPNSRFDVFGTLMGIQPQVIKEKNGERMTRFGFDTGTEEELLQRRKYSLDLLGKMVMCEAH